MANTYKNTMNLPQTDFPMRGNLPASEPKRLEKWEQEQRSLLKVDDGFKKIIVTKEGLEPHYNENGILVMNIYDFLLDKDSLDF